MDVKSFWRLPFALGSAIPRPNLDDVSFGISYINKSNLAGARNLRQNDLAGGRHGDKAVAIAKLVAPTAAFEIIKDVMVWHGAYGYTKEAGLERGLRGVTSYLVGAEGTMNIMKIIIGKELLGKEFSPI